MEIIFAINFCARIYTRRNVVSKIFFDMLEKKLAEAKQKNKNQRNQLIFGSMLIVVLCAFFVYAITFFKITPREQVTTSSVQESPQKPSAKEVKQDTPKKPHIEIEVLDSSNTLVSNDGTKEKFIEILKSYESSTEIQLNKIDLEAWDKEKYLYVTDQKENAISDFSAGKFDEAISKISDLEEYASKLIDQGERLYNEELNQAKKFHIADQYNDAKFHIERSLIFNRESSEALELQKKINELPKIIPLIKEIKIADIENNYQKEYELINKLLSIDPDRTELLPRKKELAKLIKDKSFSSFIAKAQKAMELEDIKKAKENIIAAKKADPERSELSNIEKKLDNLEKRIRLDSAIENAKSAADEDDWATAKKFLELALKDAPDNNEILNTLKTSNQIIKFKALFSIYIKDPYKLANEKNIEEMQIAIEQTRDISLLSKTLEQKRQVVTENLAKMNNKIPVDVISDQKTYVLVRGVGKVGTIEKKTIQLRPGNYIFEGQREGFKSKLVKVFIPIEQTSFTVKVVCDEPI